MTAKREAPGAAAKREARAEMSNSSAHIMVINDTDEILELFRDILEGEGYRVTLYSFAPHELLSIEKTAPDLLILDLMFGAERLGWQLLEKLRLNRATANIPVILCTAATREVREIEGHLKAMNTTLVAKPFDINVLLQAIRSALAGRGHVVQSGDENAAVE